MIISSTNQCVRNIMQTMHSYIWRTRYAPARLVVCLA
jgi:hypothetical protein